MPCVMLADDGECESKYGVCVGWAKYDNEHPDIVWGVLIINTGYMVYLVEEIYQITTA